MNEEDILKYAYWVLRDSYPDMMSVKEIANMIQEDYCDKPVSKCQVHNALSKFAHNNPHFRFCGNTYSVQILNEPFTPKIPKIRPEVKKINLTPVKSEWLDGLFNEESI